MRTLDSFPKVRLGIFPTPVHKLDRISEILGTNVYIKRDDLTGLGLGGNKVRKLEYLLADAREQGAEIVFTTGGAQSNHAMLTAAAAGKTGMKPILILKKRGVTACEGNQLLEALMGTDVRFMDTDDYADIYREMDRVGKESGKPYYKIPCGGSNALGSLGYVECAREIRDQGRHFDYLICAEGSGGTMAGLALGARLFLPETRVCGMMVDTDPFDVITPRLMKEACSPRHSKWMTGTMNCGICAAPAMPSLRKKGMQPSDSWQKQKACSSTLSIQERRLPAFWHWQRKGDSARKTTFCLSIPEVPEGCLQ